MAERGDWVAWVPFASEYAYGVRIAPRAHFGSLPALDAAARDDLAADQAHAPGRAKSANAIRHQASRSARAASSGTTGFDNVPLPSSPDAT